MVNSILRHTMRVASLVGRVVAPIFLRELIRQLLLKLIDWFSG